MASTASTPDTIAQLRSRMAGMQDGMPRLPLETHPALAGLVQLRAGGSYAVDSAALALTLLAGRVVAAPLLTERQLRRIVYG